jgi:hypothetical protein
VVGVFVGEELPGLMLHRLFPANEVPGPDCASEHSFRAVAGTKYDIAVQGEASAGIPGSVGPTVGEGSIKLQITPTAPPPDDDFANAATFRQLIWEMPSGERLLTGGIGGDNWDATSEPGEPVHAGVGGGASVWYRLVAPGAGTIDISTALNSFADPVLAVYTGSAVSGLTPIVATASNPGWPVSFAAESGEEFRIAVDGLKDAEGAPAMGNFMLYVSEALPPGTSNASGAPELQMATVKPRPAAGATAPDAPPAPPQVNGRTVDSQSGTASFRFTSKTDGARFRCSLDRAPFRACASPLRLRHLRPGAHRLGIESVLGGRPVSAPSVIHFAIAAHPHRHKAG